MSGTAADVDALVDELRALGSEKDRAGMARFGINAERAFGVSMTSLRPIAKRLGRDQALSQALWASGWHEARILAVLIAEPRKVDVAQMNAWTAEFDSWDLCDQACIKLFVKTPHTDDRIKEWTADEREFVRRAGFALMATSAVHLKKTPDDVFLGYLELIDRYAGDERNHVRKAVNWALRQIGKRSMRLHDPALSLAKELEASSDKTQRWVGRDAARELSNPVQIERIKERDAKRKPK